MANLSSAIQFARTVAQTDSNGLSDANAIIFANEALLDYHRQLITHGIDASQLQESYANFTPGTGTYLYPTDMYFLKAIELNYANTLPQDYRRAEQVDVSNLPGGVSFSWLRSLANKQSPLFDDRGDWFEVFPTPTSADNATQAIRIFYYLEPTEFTSTSDTIPYPSSLDYRTLGWRIAKNYYYSLNKFNEGEAFNTQYQQRVDQQVSTLGRGTQQPLQAVPIPLTGFEY